MGYDTWHLAGATLSFFQKLMVDMLVEHSAGFAFYMLTSICLETCMSVQYQRKVIEGLLLYWLRIRRSIKSNIGVKHFTDLENH